MYRPKYKPKNDQKSDNEEYTKVHQPRVNNHYYRKPQNSNHYKKRKLNNNKNSPHFKRSDSVIDQKYINIEIEYTRYRTMKKIEQIFVSYAKTKHDKLKLSGILERWVTNLVNQKVDLDDQILTRQFLNIKATDDMKKEIKDFSLMKEEEVHLLMVSMNNEIVRFFDELNVLKGGEIMCGNVVVEDNRVKYKTFYVEVCNERIMNLKRFAQKEDIVSMFLRYACLLPCHKQFSMPQKVYDTLHSNYHLDLEGFASPYNSMLLKYMTPGDTSIGFCSLFSDVDGIFGSFGSFFNHNIIGKVSFLAPSSSLFLLDITTDRVIKDFNSGDIADTLTIMVVPAWKDAEFYIKLKQNSFFYHEYDSDIYFENPLTEETIYCNRKISFFVFASGKYKDMNFDVIKTLY